VADTEAVAYTNAQGNESRKNDLWLAVTEWALPEASPPVDDTSSGADRASVVLVELEELSSASAPA
jgi:hypothetical protein